MLVILLSYNSAVIAALNILVVDNETAIVCLGFSRSLHVRLFIIYLCVYQCLVNQGCMQSMFST